VAHAIRQKKLVLSSQKRTFRESLRQGPVVEPPKDWGREGGEPKLMLRGVTRLAGDRGDLFSTGERKRRSSFPREIPIIRTKGERRCGSVRIVKK